MYGKKLTILLSCLVILAQTILSANVEEQISGEVLDLNGMPLIGANVFWEGTTIGGVTDDNGKFNIPPAPANSTDKLIASYVGYINDTIVVSTSKPSQSNLPVTFVLADMIELNTVNIVERRAAVLKSRTAAFDVETLNSEELCKAACCNLSEAFETNASVDVAYADAATGAKTIRLLGLSGTYVQLLSENTPGVRGLAQNFGMEYIPGPWMNSIQVSKGTSSVINGYEATTGQINVEYLKPQTQDPVAINVMLNSELHAELNVEGGWNIPLQAQHQSLYTGILAHYQNGSLPMDDNKDGFLDMPLSNNLNIANRWFYKNHDYTLQAFVRGLYDARDGGQRHTHNSNTTLSNPYLITLRTHRIDGFLKNGIVFDEETGSSVGIIAAASYHDQHNTYGLRQWDASQWNAYLNAIYQANFEGGNSDIDIDHRLSTGLSFNYDKYNEQIFEYGNSGAIAASTTLDLSRQEFTPGIFAEYSLKVEEQLSLVSSVRADWSSRYGIFATPRLNVRYSPWEWWSIRASLGLGYRSPNVIADNAFMLPSSRMINTTYIPVANQERAINTGVSTTFHIPTASGELSVSAEYYFTNFFDCVVADLDRSAHSVTLYNISDIGGRSFAHNAQIEATMEILRGWTLTAAFRYTDTRQTTFTTLPYYTSKADATEADGSVAVTRLKPLTNRWKGIITTSYQTPLKKWQFDLTAQFNGGGRMPDGFNTYFLQNLGSSQYSEQADGSLYYKWYPQLMAQVTKYFRTCSIYLGAENMTNFRQENPIIDADKPFGTDFDASMAWGPITGWKVYLGFRWALEKNDD